MLGYAVETRPAHKASPTTLTLIVAGHAALILAVVNSRMDVPERSREQPTWVESIERPKDPPPQTPEPRLPPSTRQSETIVPLPPLVPVPHLGSSDPYVPPTIPTPEIGPLPLPIPDPPAPVLRVGPKLAVAEHLLRPPYPEAKRRLEQEAVLRLRLSIDERGWVRSVEPVRAADPMFLASARNHLIRHWHYTPATEGGRPVASTIVITLRFKLDEA